MPGTLLAANRVMWLKFMGQPYAFSVLENAKPLLSFILGVFGIESLNIISPAACAVIVLMFCRLTQRCGASAIEGVAASAFFFFCNGIVLYDMVFFNGNIIYLAILFSAVTLFIEGHRRIPAGLLFLAGLWRPETWLLSGLFCIWQAVKRQFKPIYLISLLAPVCWMFFDRRISGDWFYSSRQITQFCRISGFNPITITQFPAVVVFFFRHYYGVLLSIIGFFGLILFSLRYRRGLLMPLIVTGIIPLFFYGFAALVSPSLFFYPRFFTPILLVTALGAALVPCCVTSRRLVRAAVLMGLILVFLRVDALQPLYARVQKDQIRKNAVNAVFSYFDSYLKVHKLTGKIALSDIPDTFSLRYGPEFSRHAITVRQIGSDLTLLKDVDLWVAIPSGEGYNASNTRLTFLYKAGEHRIGNTVFKPVYVHDLFIIYKLDRAG